MKNRLLVFFVTLLSICCLTACSTPKEQQETPEQQDEIVEDVEYTFGFSCITMDNPYFIALESEIRANVEAAGHRLVTLNAEADTNLQDSQIQELIEMDVDAVFLAPYDWIAIEPSVDKLREAGIKIINVDTQVQAFDKVDAFVGSNNVDAGYACGKDLLEKVPQGGKIIIVECPNRNSINERIKGFERAIAKKGFQVVARIDAKADLNVALPEVKTALENNPDVVAIMCGNDASALGALVAANVAEVDNILIYGIDGSPDVKKELAKESTLITATAGQSTKEIGSKAVEAAIKLMKQEEFKKVTYIPTFMITKENVDTYGIEEWQ